MSVNVADELIDSDEQKHQYVIGIDLGTTNIAVAYFDLNEVAQASGHPPIRLFEIPQLVAPGEVARRSTLPASLYLPGEYDLPAGSTALPWAHDRSYAVGELAREQGARVPGRLVSSAKSWLSHAGVDRTAPILPWGASGEIPKASPVDASMRYLQHLREAWDAQMAVDRPERAFDQQMIILTVPASFDEVARELTIEAARQAGFPHAILLEEPLAAFYDWLARHTADWQAQMRDGQIILVCDVGGGTTDFTLVCVREGEAGVRFDRLAVGEHLMLGGDNMDLTLGRHLEAQLLGRPGALDALRWHQLVHQCRVAKETLLGGSDQASAVDITIMGTGGQVVGGAISGSLAREDVQRLILDGFFPEVAPDDQPDTRRTGLTELGLPYVQDPAITRQLAAFWRRFEALAQAETGRDVVYPDFVLFNGGTLIPESVRARLRATISAWFQPLAGSDWSPFELHNPHPELAVALGAAYYGLVRLGQGVRVGSGSPRAYYVAVETADRADLSDRTTAVCLVPRGTEEGFAIQLDEPSFVAVTNQPVSFQLLTSSTRLGDRLGDVVRLAPDEITPLPPIRTMLRYGRGVVNSIPVQLAVRLTAIGTLEVWCQAQQSDHRWQLQFDLRQEADAADNADSPQTTIDQGAIEAAQQAIRQTFQHADRSGEHAPSSLRKTIETAIGMRRDAWPTQVIRQLADTLIESQAGRTRSADHEARWLNLLGFCMRPGFGDPLDEWRMQQVWKLSHQGLSFAKDAQSRSEWWTFWRRVAGGLTAGRQTHIYQQIWPHLQSGKSSKQKDSPFVPKHLRPGEETDIWMMLASFERLAASTKIDLGRQLLQRFAKKQPSTAEIWALSRIGSRKPIYGPLDRVVAADEVATWIDSLLAMQLAPTDDVAYCLVLLAQRTGDRGRDVGEDTRDYILGWLAQRSDTGRFQELLLNAERRLDQAEQTRIWGDALPAGLVLPSGIAETAG